jgi:hypothetical protein
MKSPALLAISTRKATSTDSHRDVFEILIYSAVTFPDWLHSISVILQQ